MSRDIIFSGPGKYWQLIHMEALLWIGWRFSGWVYDFFICMGHLKLATPLLSQPLLPGVYPKADWGPWGYFRLKFPPQFTCLFPCHQSTIITCYDRSLQMCYVCVCIWVRRLKLQWLLPKKSFLLFWPLCTAANSNRVQSHITSFWLSNSKLCFW